MKYLFFLISLFSTLGAHEIVVRSTSGQSQVVVVNPEDSFVSVIQQLESIVCDSNESGRANDFWIDFSKARPTDDLAIKKVKNTKIVRSYEAGISRSEKAEIAYIVNTLAKASLPEIIAKKSSLKKAGTKVDHVHPLHFAGSIFADEELKAGVHAIRGRVSWIWNGFMDGLATSLKEESANNNLKTEYIQDFCNKLGIPIELVLPSLTAHRWQEFVDILIGNIPREGNRDRYGI